MTITTIKAREVFDSRGNPTIEVDMYSDKANIMVRSMVPSGASTGIHEALELRDNDKSRLAGKGVLKAVENVNTKIAPKIKGMDPGKQTNIDKTMIELDGTENKSKLGANAILGVSMAACKLAAAENNLPLYQYIASLAGVKDYVLPVPSFKVINGGKQGAHELSIQEFMISPVGAATFRQAMQMGVEVYQNLKNVIKNKYGITAIGLGDEGGFSPPINRAEEAIEFLLDAIKLSGYTDKVKIAMDSAASEFYDNDTNKYKFEGKMFSPDEMLDFYSTIAEKYPIISFEDPFYEDDFATVGKLTAKIGQKIQIVGDDLLVTNIKRIQKAIDNKSCNALLLKVNQIGTVTESIQAAQLAQKNGWGVMVSHRSGETEDRFIADLVVGLRTGEIKTGALARSERLVKNNQVLRIEEQLEEKNLPHKYAGMSFRKP